MKHLQLFYRQQLMESLLSLSRGFRSRLKFRISLEASRVISQSTVYYAKSKCTASARKLPLASRKRHTSRHALSLNILDQVSLKPGSQFLQWMRAFRQPTVHHIWFVYSQFEVMDIRLFYTAWNAHTFPFIYQLIEKFCYKYSSLEFWRVTAFKKSRPYTV